LQAEKQDGQQVMNFGAAYEPTLEQQFEEADNEYNTLIRFLHEQQFQDIVTGKPVLEIVYNICEKFRLFSLQEDLAYLQAFVDQISQFERNHASELTGFLDWWNDNGQPLPFRFPTALMRSLCKRSTSRKDLSTATYLSRFATGR
jgi:hypothetical protein